MPLPSEETNTLSTPSSKTGGFPPSSKNKANMEVPKTAVL